ncbi:hypothetical protein ABFB09_05185 [Dehalogenimonas sp. THU2]|uniref:hypothetical protein n=1 Tax=Dehalogenimonas sp. THU2 TaxID=3151121 RepID=UPI0032183B28
MDNVSAWMAGIVVGLGGAAIAFYYQGKAMAEPNKQKEIGLQLQRIAQVWGFLVFGIFVAFILLQFIG